MKHIRGSIKHNCAVCGVLFVVSPSHAQRGGGITCSSTCRDAVRGFAHHVRENLPGTVQQVADACHVSLAVVRALIGKMLRAGECHISGFERNALRNTPGAPTFMPIIALGADWPDLDMPHEMRAAVTYHTRKRLLEKMPGRVSDLAKSTGMPETSTLAMVKKMNAEGLCHIGKWQRSARGLATAIYVKGTGENLPCNVRKLTPTERDNRYKKKMRQNPDIGVSFDNRQAINRNRYWTEKAKQGDPLINALFGPRKPSTQSGDQQP